MNIQGISPSCRSNSRWKLPKFREEVTSIRNNNFNIPFIALTESWLKPEITEAQLTIEGFNIFRCDRQKSQHGGVLLYINNNIIIDGTETYDDDKCEAVVCISKLSSCIFCCLYRPPTAPPSSFNGVLKFLEDFIMQHDPLSKFNLLLFGDFNLPNLKWDICDAFRYSTNIDNAYNIFGKFMDRLFLSQYVKESTRGKNILDLFLTNDSNFVHLVQSTDIQISDHNLITIFTDFFKNLDTESNTACNNTVETTLDFSIFNFAKANVQQIDRAFAELDWDTIISNTSIDDFPEMFNYLVFSVLKQHCPLFVKKGDKIVLKNRFTKERKIFSRKIRKYNKRIIQLKQIDVNHPDIVDLNSKVKELTDKQKQSFYSEKYEEEHKAVSKIKSDNKYFFKYANKFRKVLTSPRILVDGDTVITDPVSVANRLQDHFKSVFSEPNSQLEPSRSMQTPEILYPLSDLNITKADILKAIEEIKSTSACPSTEIPAKILKKFKSTLSYPLKLFWSKSFNSGCVPFLYKLQQVIPIHKKRSKTDEKNFRPISLTSHIIKIFERVLRDKLAEYFERNKLINLNQHGFRKGRSCLTQLVSHITDIQNNLVQNKEVDTIFIDYAKAFDKIDHHILINKLSKYGLPHKYIKWIKCFLSNRRQFVYINSVKSYEVNVKSGVPQGSVLGPLLFIIYINDLCNSINYSKMLTFADDTKIAFPISSYLDTLLLQSDLNNIIEWSQNNNMKLNENKFELITHKINKSNPVCDFFKELPFSTAYNEYFTGKNLFSPSIYVRDLGVLVDCELNWNVHISNLCKVGRQLSGWVLSIFYTRDKLTMLTLFNSIVRSKLEYCSQIWDPFLIKHISAIEQIQRNFTKKIQGLKDLNYWERLDKLELMSLQRRREKLTIIFVWKIKYNLVPNDINLEFSTNNRRSGSVAIVKPMPRSAGKLLSMFENSFIVKSAKLWNKLPLKLKQVDSLTVFKSQLDKYLKLIPDRPPIRGYYHTNKNSILDFNIQPF